MEQAARTTSGINDIPVGDVRHDALGRSAFAKSVYDLALGATDDTSIRVGLYGDWGEGKTSVLNMIEADARADNVLVMRFDPWTAKTSTELWGLFVQQLRDVLEMGADFAPESGEAIKRSAPARRAARTVVSLGRTLTSFAGPAKRFLDMLAATADAKLAGNAATVLKLLTQHDDRKIIVLVDELDRTAPALVPEVLLTIRSILDIPGFSFVLAFDERAVQRSLHQTNEKWGENLRFLEKVIEYPRHLPPLDSRTTLRLAEQLRANYASWLPKPILANLEPLLPRNPRRLKLYLRNLWMAGRQVGRFGEHEIDYSILALTSLLRTQSPSLFEAFLADEQTWSALRAKSLATYRARNNEEESETAALQAAIDKLLTDNGLARDAETDRIRETIQRFTPTVFRRDVVSLCAHLADSPPTFSSSEILVLAQTAPDELPQDLEGIASSRYRTVVDVCIEAFSVAADTWGWKMAQATETSLESEAESHARAAIAVVTLLQRLTTIANGAFTQSELSKGLEVAVRWAHFDNLGVYQELRDLEAAMLVHLVQSSETHDVLGLARTVRESQRALHGDQQSDLIRRVNEALEPKLADMILKSLDIPEIFSDLVAYDNGAYIHPVLFEASSFFWRDYRCDFIAKCRDHLPQRCGSFMEYISRLAHYATDYAPYCDRNRVAELAMDDEVVVAAWSAALVHRAQPRQVGELMRVQTQLEAVRNSTLPLPKWAEDEFARRRKEDAQSDD